MIRSFDDHNHNHNMIMIMTIVGLRFLAQFQTRGSYFGLFKFRSMKLLSVVFLRHPFEVSEVLYVILNYFVY